MTPLDTPQRQALLTLRTLAGALGLPAPPPNLADQAALASYLTRAQAAVDQARRDLERELSEAQARLDADAQQGDAEEASWQRLIRACDAVDSLLKTAPESLIRRRLEEGRRSMLPRVERLIREKLEAQVVLVGRRMEARPTEEGLHELQRLLPGWVEAWENYSFRWVDVDIERAVQEIWLSKEGDLPIPPPPIQPLAPAEVSSALEIPTIEISREQLNLGASIYRHGRAALYGLLSMLVLLGINFRSHTVDSVTSWWDTYILSGYICVILTGIFVAVLIGYVQASAERQSARAQLSVEAKKRADQAVWEAVRHWLDRIADKLTDDARYQLQQRRTNFVTWYRAEVMPRIDQRQRERALRGQRAEEARRTRGRAEQRRTNLDRFTQEIDALVATSAG